MNVSPPRRLLSNDTTSTPTMRSPTYSGTMPKRHSQTFRSSPLARPAVSSEATVDGGEKALRSKNTTNPSGYVVPTRRVRSLSSDSLTYLRDHGPHQTPFPSMNDLDYEFGAGTVLPQNFRSLHSRRLSSSLSESRRTPSLSLLADLERRSFPGFTTTTSTASGVPFPPRHLTYPKRRTRFSLSAYSSVNSSRSSLSPIDENGDFKSSNLVEQDGSESISKPPLQKHNWLSATQTPIFSRSNIQTQNVVLPIPARHFTRSDPNMVSSKLKPRMTAEPKNVKKKSSSISLVSLNTLKKQTNSKVSGQQNSGTGDVSSKLLTRFLRHLSGGIKETAPQVTPSPPSSVLSSAAVQHAPSTSLPVPIRNKGEERKRLKPRKSKATLLDHMPTIQKQPMSNTSCVINEAKDSSRIVDKQRRHSDESGLLRSWRNIRGAHPQTRSPAPSAIVSTHVHAQPKQPPAAVVKTPLHPDLPSFKNKNDLPPRLALNLVLSPEVPDGSGGEKSPACSESASDASLSSLFLSKTSASGLQYPALTACTTMNTKYRSVHVQC